MEERTALTPVNAKRLLEAGFRITVEESSQSRFSAQQFSDVGCEIVAEHAWKTSAPEDCLVLGLKELETETTPLSHRHIHFAHVYKNQAGWKSGLEAIR